MKNKKFFPEKLKVGDIIEVTTVLGGTKDYEVLDVYGNSAYTKFRYFIRDVRYDGQVFERGKGTNHHTTNVYYKKQKSLKDEK